MSTKSEITLIFKFYNISIKRIILADSEDYSDICKHVCNFINVSMSGDEISEVPETQFDHHYDDYKAFMGEVDREGGKQICCLSDIIISDCYIKGLEKISSDTYRIVWSEYSH